MKSKKTPSKNNNKKTLNKKEGNSPAPTPTPGIVDIPQLTVEENERFINHINAFLQKKEKPRRENITEYSALTSAISEFLDSYITLGYTYDGKRVLIQQCSTPKDKDAILEFLKNVFVANASKDSMIDTDSDDE